jgi:hypothetical protein
MNGGGSFAGVGSSQISYLPWSTMSSSESAEAVGAVGAWMEGAAARLQEMSQQQQQSQQQPLSHHEVLGILELLEAALVSELSRTSANYSATHAATSGPITLFQVVIMLGSGGWSVGC